MKIAGIFGGLASNLLSGMINSNMQLTNQSALMQQQLANQKNLNAFNAKLNDSYQRSMLFDSASLQKASLQSAGLSAGSMLSSYSPSGSNVNSSGAAASGSAISPGINLSLIDAMLGISQAKLNETAAEKNEAETNKIDKETSWIDSINDANVSKTIAETANAKQQLFNLRQTLDESVARMKLTNEQRDQVRESINKLIAETEGIKINNMYLQEVNEANIANIMANCKKALSDANYTSVRSELAKMGIGVSSNWVESLVALSHFGNAGVAIKDVKRGLEDAVEALVEPSAEDKKTDHSVASALGARLGRAIGWFVSLID